MTGISYFLCKVFLGLCKGIFSAISGVYALFYGLATAQFFNNDTIQAVSNNIYMFVSIVILFAFAVKLIEAIVNPDLLTDNKKGVTGVLTRTIIGLILIVAIPSIFNLVYKLQSEVITNSLVEKMILNSMDTDSSNGMSGAGGVLTSSIITGFIVPLDETGGQITEYQVCKDDMSCNFADELLELNPDFEGYVPLLGSINDYSVISDLNIDKQWDNEQQIYEVNLFPLILIGLFILYQVILLCFDAGLRLVELGILQMMSPIVIVSYIAAGPEYLQKWAKLTGQKFLSVFIRIAALCLMVLGFRLMNDRNASIFNSESATFWFKVFVIIGLLRLVKELPDIISNIFGVDMKNFGGGIKGRLESMAGIGGLAGKAWSSLGKGAKGIAASTGLMVAGGAGNLIKRGAKSLDQHAFKGKVGSAWTKVKESKLGRGAKVWATGVKAGGNISATGKALSDNYKKEFAAEIYEQEKKDKEFKDKQAAKPIARNSKGTIAYKPDGKVNWDQTLSNIKAKGTCSLDVSLDTIEGSKLSGAAKDDLSALTRADYNLKRSQHLMNNMDNMTRKLESLKSTVGKEDALKIDAMIDDIRKGRIHNDAEFKTHITDVVQKMNVSDMSKANDIFANAINSVGNELKDPSGHTSTQLAADAKKDLLHVQSLVSNGTITNKTDLEHYLSMSSAIPDEIKDSVLDSVSFGDPTLMNAAVSELNDLAGHEGAYFVDGGYDKLSQDVQKNTEAYEKAKEKSKERANTLYGSAKEEYERLSSLSSGTISHEFRDRELDHDELAPGHYSETLSAKEVDKKDRVAHGTTPTDPTKQRANTNH